MAQCEESMGASFVYSLVATDVCTGWTEAVPLLAREQSLVVAGPEAIAKQFPCPALGIVSGNDSVFINGTLTEYSAPVAASSSPVRGTYWKNARRGVNGGGKVGHVGASTVGLRLPPFTIRRF